MKLALTCAAWFAAGFGAHYFIAPSLFEVWFLWGFRAPVADWLAQHVSYRIAGTWGLVWVRAVDALFVGTAGVLGGLFVRKQLLLKVFLFSLGFVVTPWSIDGRSMLSFGLDVAIHLAAWDAGLVAFSIALSLAVAALRRKKGGRGFDVGGFDGQPPADAVGGSSDGI